MSEEDFACDKFVAQKWRGDVCRNCYQPLRLHTKRQLKLESAPKTKADSAKSKTPKVLERFKKKHDSQTAGQEEPTKADSQQLENGKHQPEGVSSEAVGTSTEDTLNGIKSATPEESVKDTVSDTKVTPPPTQPAVVTKPSLIPSKPPPPRAAASISNRPTRSAPSRPPPPPRTTSIGSLSKPPQTEPVATPPQQTGTSPEPVATPPQQTGTSPEPAPTVVASPTPQTDSLTEQPVATPPQTEPVPEQKEPEQTLTSPEPPPQQTEETPPQTEPVPSLPEQTEPEQTEPEQTEPEQTEPEQTEPEQTEPEQTEPEQTEPEQTEPEQTKGAPGATEVAELVEDEASSKEEGDTLSPQQTEETLSPEEEPVCTQVEGTTVSEQVPAPSSRPPPPPRSSSIGSLSRKLEPLVSSPPLQTVEDTVQGAEEMGGAEEAVPVGNGEDENLVTEDSPVAEVETELKEDTCQEERSVSEDTAEGGVASVAVLEGGVELNTDQEEEAAQEADSAVFEPPEPGSPGDEVKSKFPMTDPEGILSPQSFTEEILPPPHAPWTDEVSPPPQFVGEVSPPPLFAGNATPPPDGVPVAPPLPDGIPIAPPPPDVAPPPPPPGPAQRAAPPLRVPSPDSAMAQAMESIRTGGVALRKVPPPMVHSVGEDKVVDVASELRLKMNKRRKQENQGMSEVLEENREEARKLAEMLVTCSGTHSFTRQLKTLLTRVDHFLEHVGLSQEVLSQNLQWPIRLVQNLRAVVEHMRLLDERVKAAELLCQQTVAGCEDSGGPSAAVGRAQPVPINPEAVDRCVTNVITLAKALVTEESRYVVAAQSFPIDESDLQTFLQRGAVAVTPLMALLYQKAFATYDSIFEPSVTNFDKRFRVQNALRLLKMCCKLSDVLSLHLNVNRHPDYSQANLKQVELKDIYSATTSVGTREGEWDTAEVVQLGQLSRATTKTQKQETELVQRVMACLKEGEGLEQFEEELTVENYAKIEGELLKSALASAEEKVIDAAITLTKKVYSGDEAATHRYDYDWLLDPVVKGNHDRIQFMVKECHLDVNCQSRDAGNSLLHRAVGRKDLLPTAACLIRLGADPTLRNAHNLSPVQMLALKCFPQSRFPTNMETKEPIMSNLASYINNPSLSDVVLISEDGSKFFAHRLVLCVQSPVFKTMLDSDLWEESRNKEVPLPTVSGRVLQYLLQYMYTGECCFPRDDLNMALDLMGVADQFFLDPMKLQCERVLSDKIDLEVVVPMYYAAFRYNTPHLVANCAHFLLTQYQELQDDGHQVLLHLLDTSTPNTT